MLTVEAALARCLEIPLSRGVETVPLDAAYGRVLAEPLVAAGALPAWDNSAMDGFAVRSEDFGDLDSGAPDPSSGAGEDCCGGPAGEGEAVLEVLETIAAGSAPRHVVGPGQCSRVMTGAPMPDGADAVVMVEHSVMVGGAGPARVRLRGGARPRQHVRRRGEEVAVGATVLPVGAILTPAAVGLCAALGRPVVAVMRRPRVAILSTGDEVIPPGQPLAPGQIWSSNTPALVGMVREAGGVALDCGNAPDTLEGTRAAFRRALERRPDVLLTTGGVSVGDFDVVKDAMAAEGAQMAFWKVRVKPGKPLALGIIGHVPAFGLPGNPVSCMVNFMQFVRPVIRRALGDPAPFLPVVDARLDGRLRKKPGRNELVRVRLHWEPGGWVATPTGPQSSGMLTSMVAAEGLLLLAADAVGAEPGDVLAVQRIDGGLPGAAEPGYRWGGRTR